MTQKEALVSLYSGIQNDFSIRRYACGWTVIVEAIEKRYPKIQTDKNIQFENKLITNALAMSKNGLHEMIKVFARELKINLETLSQKDLKPQNR